MGETAIGTLEGNTLTEYSGDLFNEPVPSGKTLSLDDVKLLAPFQPRSIIALWNNFHERAKEEGQEIPLVPLYFMKPVSSVIGPGSHSQDIICIQLMPTSWGIRTFS
jgi:2-keto-4-pentenoate hydratase/2-oxohepta-3-ene-1,7-dioic acid hydratase in catechol pathway